MRTLSAAKLISETENEFMQLELFQLIKQTESIKTDKGFDFRENSYVERPFPQDKWFYFHIFSTRWEEMPILAQNPKIRQCTVER